MLHSRRVHRTLKNFASAHSDSNMCSACCILCALRQGLCRKAADEGFSESKPRFNNLTDYLNIALGNDHGVVCRIDGGERKLLSEALDMPQKHLVSDTHNADAIVVRLNTFPHQNERAFNDVDPPSCSRLQPA